MHVKFGNKFYIVYKMDKCVHCLLKISIYSAINVCLNQCTQRYIKAVYAVLYWARYVWVELQNMNRAVIFCKVSHIVAIMADCLTSQ